MVLEIKHVQITVFTTMEKVLEHTSTLLIQMIMLVDIQTTVEGQNFLVMQEFSQKAILLILKYKKVIKLKMVKKSSGVMVHHIGRQDSLLKNNYSFAVG